MAPAQHPSPGAADAGQCADKRRSFPQSSHLPGCAIGCVLSTHSRTDRPTTEHPRVLQSSHRAANEAEKVREGGKAFSVLPEAELLFSSASSGLVMASNKE